MTNQPNTRPATFEVAMYASAAKSVLKMIEMSGRPFFVSREKILGALPEIERP